MSTAPTAFIRPLAEAEPYEQQEPGEAAFRSFSRHDEIPGLDVGHVHLKGPIHKTPGAHEEWHQAYFVYAGAGVIHLDDTARPVEAPALISIPRHTRHSVQVPDGGEMRYIFVNQWR